MGVSDVAPDQGSRMKRTKHASGVFGLITALLLVIVVLGCGSTGEEQVEETIIGEAPALKVHTSQEAIINGDLTLEEIIERGESLFVTSFNTLDGAGRPETANITTPGNVTVIHSRPRQDFPNTFNRISGPDANTCLVCHSVPRVGGGGDFATNSFIDADQFPFVNFDGGEGDNNRTLTLAGVGLERNAPGLFGSGLIEMLAREMTVELQSIVVDAIEEAKRTNVNVTKDLVTKGVSFGRITARPDAAVDTSEVEGVDDDLVIRPFQHKGVVVSLREFAVKAMNFHFGMQASENFREGGDPDRDGVMDELTPGDITALVLFQAMMPPPGQIMPAGSEAQAAVERGRQLFTTTGCASCHIPELRLNDPVFTEPSPFNPSGKLQPTEGNLFAVDLINEGRGPGLKREPDGSVLVPVFSDLKRHRMGDLLNNDLFEQDGVPLDEWLTRRLWGFANEPPYLHHGRATLISEAILAHGGEAQDARDAFVALPLDEQASVIEFLKTLQILPEGSTSLVGTAGETARGSQAISGGVLGAIFLMVSGGVVFGVKKKRG